MPNFSISSSSHSLARDHMLLFFFFSSRRRHTRSKRDWSSDCALPIYGRYEFDGVTYQVPLDEPPQAMHGLVRWTSWRPVAVAKASVELEYLLHPSPGYPFALRLRVEYLLGADGLTVRTSAENVGVRAAPFGVGHHPYVARHADDVFGPG